MDLGTAKTLRTEFAKSVSAAQPVLDDVTEMSGRSTKRQEAEPKDDRDNEQWVQRTGEGPVGSQQAKENDNEQGEQEVQQKSRDGKSRQRWGRKKVQ